MLSAALRLPVDRLESATRRDVPEPVPEAPSGPRFADLLQQRRATAAPPPAESRPAESKPTHETAPADDPPPAPKPARGGTRASAARPGKEVERPDAVANVDRRGTEPADPRRVDPTEATDPGAEVAKKASQTSEAGVASATPLAAMPANLDAAPRAARATTSDAASAEASAAPAQRSGKTAGASPREAAAAVGEDAQATAEPKPAPTIDPPVVPATATPDAVRPAPVAREIAPPLPSVAPLAALRTGEAAAVPPPVVALPTPLHAPDFAQTLGAQVSVFARDGLQQAELRINPPEMGPIGVQIEIDGRDARVNFHAGMAATREVLERALPELAAALRSEGLTLAGGGVFDGSAAARQQARDQAGQGAPRGGRTGDDGPPGRPLGQPALRTTQGALDLYA